MIGGRRPQTRVWTVAVLGSVVGLALVVSVAMVGGGPTGTHPVAGRDSGARSAVPLGSSAAASVREVGPPPTEATAGTPANFSWEAFTAAGTRANTFAAVCYVAVTDANGTAAPAWVNSSVTGALPRLANGSFQVPSPAWNAGLLEVSVEPAWATMVTVQLFGSFLPNLPVAVALPVLPDLDHLVVTDASWTNQTFRGSWSASVLWDVRDRFGDPAPGATLVVRFTDGAGVRQSFVPVVWAPSGGTVARVNYSAVNGTEGTITVRDAAGDLLFGPTGVPTLASGASATSNGLPPVALAAVTLLGVGGVVGVVVLASGGRGRPSPSSREGEEELRRLAEGREAVVTIVREGGPLELREIEARWEPPPAPPAVADWVASLVSDGTLTAALGEGGRARFELAARPVGEPRVTLDEDALERGIARRDAEVTASEEEREP